MPSVPIIFFFFATTTILPTFVSAQLIVPVCCMSYTNIDETRLYIQGGLNNNRTTVNQFIALDLTVPAWEASAPPWSKPQNLNGTNPPISSWHSMVAAKDRGKLFIWDALQTTAVWWTYNIVEKSWRNYAVPIGTPEMAATNSSYLVNITRQAGIRNGVNVATGEVYISSGTDNGTQMSIHTIDPTTGLPATSQPSSFKQDPIVHESFVWSGYRNSFLHYGGRSMNGTNSNSQLNELLSMNGWMAVKTTGTSPGDVSGHCMVPAYGGQSMIVFGGTGLDGIAKADIHILDLPTSKWTTGRPADASQARTNMACAVSGDSFIAWGGESNNVNKDAVPIIYDIRNNEWTTQFKRYTGADASRPFNPARSGAVPNVAESTTNIAAIGGGMAGALVVVAIIGFLFYRRCITSRKEMHNDRSESAIGLSLRDPQNPDGDPTAELLGVVLPSSSSPTSSLRMYYDREYFFRRLAASPLAGPHSLMREPQGEQQHRSTTGDEVEFVRSNSGFHDQRPPSLISPRSPHMVNHAIAAQSGWPSDDDDNGNSDKHEGDKSAQRQPPLPSPQNLQTRSIDGQDGPPRAPQWQQSLPPVVFLDQSQYLERSQELAWMMEVIKAEKEVLDRRKLVQDVLVAQLRANYHVSPSDPHK